MRGPLSTRTAVVALPVCVALGLIAGAPALQARTRPASDAAPTRPRSVAVVTTHHMQLAGRTITYRATAGEMLLRKPGHAPTALMSYFAYTRTGVGDPASRPIMFLYDGGPGFSSIWINMGAFGPRRVVTADAASSGAPPYRLVDNAYSLLDAADLVFIDPVGTGYSHAVGKATDRQFWGVDPDMRSIAQFITQYVSRHDRWNSPKFLAGLSYGTFRSVVVANYLQSHESMYINGIVLISSVLDLGTVRFRPGADLPYILYLPSYAATAWYHHALNPRPPDLPAFLTRVRAFASTTYADALREGSALGAARKAAVARQLAQYTGLPVGYLMRADLRVTLGQFVAELERDHGIVLSRLDSRFTGPTYDPLSEAATYDPIRTSIYGAFTGAFHAYLADELRFHPGRPYVVSSGAVGRDWNWTHRERGARRGFPGAPNVEPDLKQALITNPHLYVQVENGYYDMATPFFETEYTMTHLGLPASLQGHIGLEYYRSGHMIWLHVPSLRRLSANIHAFIAAHAGS